MRAHATEELARTVTPAAAVSVETFANVPSAVRCQALLKLEATNEWVFCRLTWNVTTSVGDIVLCKHELENGAENGRIFPTCTNLMAILRPHLPKRGHTFYVGCE